MKSEAVRGVLRKVYSKGKWVVQWDHLIAVPGRPVYIVLGASKGRVFVVSMFALPAGELAFEGLYQLPLDWHGSSMKTFRPEQGKRFVGDKQRIIDFLEVRARSFNHIVGDYSDGNATYGQPPVWHGRTLERWFQPPEGFYWRWRSTATKRADLLTQALACALQHPRESRKPRVRCKHCHYPGQPLTRAERPEDTFRLTPAAQPG